MLDRWAAVILVPLAIWVLVSGLDDLLIDLAWLYRTLFRLSPPPPTEAQLTDGLQRRIAIFVPLWKEHRVIRRMVEHNIAAQKYTNYDFFIGAYPNDAPTLAALADLEEQFSNVHVAKCPHNGPTSKADCLNWIYQRMLLFEEQAKTRFEIIITHDAEDLIHPEALRWNNYYAAEYDMVQIPVLALPTSPWEFTHGVYCDEFAQFQFRDMPVRNMLGGFVPSNGVGTGFSRDIIERLAAAHSNRIFEPACLTEDYENGFRVHQLGGSQFFIPITKQNGAPVATREYFPRKFRAAVRQRTRWTTGITLQSWEQHGWRDTLRQGYWFWRDRKSLLNNLLTPLIHLLTLYGAGTLGFSYITHTQWGFAKELQHFLPPAAGTLLATLEAIHITLRSASAGRIYGWRFALLSPVRMVWGSWINFLAASHAIRQYATARLRKRPLVWLKTEHAYPNRSALVQSRHSLDQILVQSEYLSATQVEQALASKPAHRSLASHLLALGIITEQDLYEAISLEQDLPLGMPDSVSEEVTRSFPAEIARKWRVLPFKVAAGHLHLAGPEPPSDEMHAELRMFSSLEMRFRLVTPTDYEELAAQYLPK